MSVEAGPSGAIGAVSAGASVNGTSFTAPSFEAAPVMAGRFINERPFEGSLEGFRPMNKLDIKTIADANRGGTVGPFVEAKLSESTALARVEPALNEQDIVEEAEHWLGIKKLTPEPKYNLSSYGITITEEGRGTNLAKKENAEVHAGVEEDIIEGVFRVLDESPAAHPKLNTILFNTPQTEGKNGALEAQAIASSTIEKHNSEQIIEEEAIFKRRFLVDKLTLSRRIPGISEAFKKAQEFFGSIKIPKGSIPKFWTGKRDSQSIAEATRPGPDGSLEETLEVFESSEFDSEEDAIKVAKDKEPVKEGKIGEDGKEASQKSVQRVFKLHSFKPTAAFEVLRKRVVKKLVPAPLVENTVSKAETRLEDYPDLEEALAPK